MVYNTQDALLGERLLMGRIRMGPLVGDTYCEATLYERLLMGSRRRGYMWGV